jgi:adenine/guanine phosphoribosyltransferase-like PRPP-binding protein
MSNHKPEYDHAGYLNYLLPTAELRKSVRLAKKELKKYEFDAIAFRGMSGALIAPTLALALNKTLIMVRKPDKEGKTHSYRDVEGDRAAKKYIIVDDQVDTGHTAKVIYDEVKRFAPNAKLLGVFCIRNMRKDKDEFISIKDLEIMWELNYLK